MSPMIKKGFTLMEVLLAALMFAFMIMSLASLYSTANKHLFQSYRQNTVKTNASTAIKDISTRLAEADRIDAPGPPGPNAGNFLRFAVNVDQSGCYPVNSALPASWHEYCYAPGITASCPFGNCLYHHTGPIAGGGVCPDGAAWSAIYPSAGLCGAAIGTVTQLAAFVQPPGGSIFSRAGPLGNTVVNINLRIVWDPALAAAAGRNFTTSGKTIDTTIATSVRVNRSGQ